MIIAVPHAGRHYAPSVIADAQLPVSRLWQIEDRYADMLVTGAIERGATAFIAEHARATIDLNRDPREIDATMIEGECPCELLVSNRTRHGLGLIPRRSADGRELWRRKFALHEIEDRIRTLHRPYHDAIARALAKARARFGIAILLDCHSMPPVRTGPDRTTPAVVIGDRFGRSAGPLFGDIVEEVARRARFSPARNAPYAGGYSLDLHGKPGQHIHALQIEIDRSRYLDALSDQPGAGLARARDLVTQIFDAISAETITNMSIAAE